MEECVFCDILQGKISRALIAENEHAIAVMDSYPVQEGHCLIIPKKHHESLIEIPEKELWGVMQLAVKVETAMMKALKCGGIDLKQHYRPFLKQSKLKVNHLHFHLIPRNKDDEIFKTVLVHELKLRKEPALQELNEIAEKIAKEIS